MLTKADKKSQSTNEVSYFHSLDLISKKKQQRYYLLSYIEALIIVLASSSSLFISSIIVANRSACLHYTLNINITVKSFFIIDIVIEAIWFLAHLAILRLFISK